MEWSKEETIPLIDVYKSKPLLWHSKHGAWRKIAAAVAEKSVEDYKKKVVRL